MEQESDPLVRMSLDVHLSTKTRFREMCAKHNIPMSERARALLERDLKEDAQTEAAR